MGAGIPVELALFAIFVGLSAFAVTMLLCLGLDLCFTNWQQRRYWRARARRLSSRRTTPPPATSAASFPTASAPLLYPALTAQACDPPSYEVAKEVDAGHLGVDDRIVIHLTPTQEMAQIHRG